MIHLVSDGSSEGIEAGCACILRIPPQVSSSVRPYIKTMAYLGEVDPAESELCGGILGLSVLSLLRTNFFSSIPEVCWFCDHEPSRLAVLGNLEVWKKRRWRSAQGAELRHQRAWQLFDLLAEEFSLSAEPPQVPIVTEHKACDRASRWARRGGLQRKTTSGAVGRLSLRDPDQAWWFIDAKEIVRQLHSEIPLAEVRQSLERSLNLRSPEMLGVK